MVKVGSVDYGDIWAESRRDLGVSYEDFSGKCSEKGTNKMQTLSMERVGEESMFMLEAFKS